MAKVIWPANLAIYYPLQQDVNWWQFTVSATVLLVATILVFRNIRRRPFLFTGWFWFIITLLPVIGLLQVNDQARADRFMYVPMIGILTMLVYGAYTYIVKPESNDRLATATKLRRAAIGAGIVALVACIVVTENQLPYWKDSITVFSHALEITPRNNGVAHLNLGIALMANGDTDAAQPHLEEAVQLKPGSAEARGMLGNVKSAKGDKRAALQFYRQALELKPELPEALNNLAWLLAATQDDSLRNGAEAVRLGEKACELTDYQRPVFIGTLAAAHAEVGEFEKAISLANKARELASTLGEQKVAEANIRLIALYQQGRPVREN